MTQTARKRSQIRSGSRVQILSSSLPSDVGQQGEVIRQSMEPGQWLIKLDNEPLSRHFTPDQLKVLGRPHLTLVCEPTALGGALSSPPSASSSADLCKGILANLYALRDKLVDQGADATWWIDSSPTSSGGVQYRRRYPKNSQRKKKTEHISKENLAHDRRIQALKKELVQVRAAIEYYEDGLKILRDIELLSVSVDNRGLEPKQTTIQEFATAIAPLPPLLKWAGGKTDVAPLLAELFQPYRATHKWIEPFLGGMGATMGVMPTEALLNDANPYSINLYKHVQAGELTTADICQEATPEMFDQIKSRFNQRNRDRKQTQAPLTKEDAALFYFIMRTTWRGLCRFNKAGVFNVGWGDYKKPILNHDFAAYQPVFQQWEFTCGDFELLTPRIDSRSFTYCDPPYVSTAKKSSGFTSYSEGGFNWDDQVRLAKWSAELPGPVVMSNAKTDRTAELYTSLGFQIREILVKRSISTDGDRTKAVEIIATKNLEVNL